MKINIKYSLGDTVWKIQNSKKQVNKPCSTCEGLGHVIINQTPSRSCPDCYGRGYNTEWEPTQWNVIDPLTIGQVRVEVESFKQDGMFSNIGTFDPDKMEQKTQYMAYETGIGSGHIHNEEDLFASDADALAECHSRNMIGQ